MTGKAPSALIPTTTPKQLPVLDPEVFIVESATLEDEANGRLEGEALATVLRMCGKQPKYQKIRTTRELQHVAGLFKESKCRYLHVSAHGTSTEVCLTLDRVPYSQFGEIFEKALTVRRLFVSACEVGNQTFVEAVAGKNKGMHSVLCPSDAIRFDKAIAFWTAFYVLAFDVDEDRMAHETLMTTAQKAQQLLGVNLYAALYKPSPVECWEYRDIR